MLKLVFCLFVVGATIMADDSENIRIARSPGGSGWQGSSNFAPQSFGLARSSGSWNGGSGNGRSTGGWGNSVGHGARPGSYKSNGFGSNGVHTRSGYGSENSRYSNSWDDSGVNYQSTW